MTDLPECGTVETLIEAVQLSGCAASSFSWISLAGPAVIAVSASIAWLSLKSSKEMARKKATLDLIEKVESTPHYRQLQAVFSYYKRSNSFHRLHDPKEDKDRNDRGAVNDYLSHYELISIGIEENVLDSQFYKKWMANPFVRDWNAASEYIQRERWKWHERTQEWRYYDKLFEHYQRVACTFSAKAIVLTKNYSPPPTDPSGPGDKELP